MSGHTCFHLRSDVLILGGGSAVDVAVSWRDRLSDDSWRMRMSMRLGCKRDRHTLSDTSSKLHVCCTYGDRVIVIRFPMRIPNCMFVVHMAIAFSFV